MKGKELPIRAIEDLQEQSRGRLIRVCQQRVQLADGTIRSFEIAERAPGVRVLVVDSLNRVLITREWRAEIGGWDYRLPGGKVFDGLDDYLDAKSRGARVLKDCALKAAKRELFEEAGLDLPLRSLRHLHRSICGTTIIWDVYYFLAVLETAGSPLTPTTADKGESVVAEWRRQSDVKQLCLSGGVQEDRTAAVLLRFVLAGGTASARRVR